MSPTSHTGRKRATGNRRVQGGLRGFALSVGLHTALVALVVTRTGATERPPGAVADPPESVFAFTLAAVLPSEGGESSPGETWEQPLPERVEAAAPSETVRLRRRQPRPPGLAARTATPPPVEHRTHTHKLASDPEAPVADALDERAGDNATAAAIAMAGTGAGTGPGADVTSAGAGREGGTTGAQRAGSGSFTPADRRRAIERYLREVLTPRIRSHTIYPEEAERLGLQADFVVRISVDGRGGLVDATLLGDGPHPLLRQSAFLALRTSAPWPPPPALLGTLVQIDVPFVYRLDG